MIRLTHLEQCPTRGAERLEEVKNKSTSHMSGPLVEKLSAALPGCTVEYVEGPPEWFVSVAYDAACEKDDYARPTLKVEGGARGALVPTIERGVVPYVQDALEGKKLKFDLRIDKMTMIRPERTMLEKLVAIHGFNSKCASEDASKRPKDANRYSRHYYDVAQISRTPHGQKALNDPDLFAAVVSHSALTFPGSGSRYDLAKPDTIAIVPTGEAQKILERDYASMSGMMFGKTPSFADIMKQLVIIEASMRELEERQMILDLAT